MDTSKASESLVRIISKYVKSVRDTLTRDEFKDKAYVDDAMKILDNKEINHWELLFLMLFLLIRENKITIVDSFESRMIILRGILDKDKTYLKEHPDLFKQAAEHSSLREIKAYGSMYEEIDMTLLDLLHYTTDTLVYSIYLNRLCMFENARDDPALKDKIEDYRCHCNPHEFMVINAINVANQIQYNDKCILEFCRVYFKDNYDSCPFINNSEADIKDFRLKQNSNLDFLFFDSFKFFQEYLLCVTSFYHDFLHRPTDDFYKVDKENVIALIKTFENLLYQYSTLIRTYLLQPFYFKQEFNIESKQ